MDIKVAVLIFLLLSFFPLIANSSLADEGSAIAIVGAMENEIEPFLLRMDVTRSYTHEDLTLWEGALNGKKVVLAECDVGQESASESIIGVTIGTGMGSSFMIDGRIVFRGKGVPRSGWIGGMSCDWGIVEERVSQRWILQRYLELTGKVAESVEQITKDAASLKVFEELGETIGDVLLPIAQRFGADCIVFGGQISKSFQLFEKPIRDRLDRVPSLKFLGRAKHIDLSPVYGAAKLVFEGFR